MDGAGVNSGLYVGEVEALVTEELLPSHAIAVEAWITIETETSGGHREGAGNGRGTSSISFDHTNIAMRLPPTQREGSFLSGLISENGM